MQNGLAQHLTTGTKAPGMLGCSRLSEIDQSVQGLGLVEHVHDVIHSMADLRRWCAKDSH